MNKKGVLISSIQRRLAGGDAPMDVRGEYHPLDIMSKIDFVFTDIAHKDPNMVANMAIPYEVTFSLDAPYRATLPIPTYGSEGIFKISIGNTDAHICNQQEYHQLKNTVGLTVLATITAGKILELSQRPPVAAATVLMIGQFSELNDDDFVIMEGYETLLFDMVVDKFRNPDPQEKINDSVKDIAIGRVRR